MIRRATRGGVCATVVFAALVALLSGSAAAQTDPPPPGTNISVEVLDRTVTVEITVVASSGTPSVGTPYRTPANSSTPAFSPAPPWPYICIFYTGGPPLNLSNPPRATALVAGAGYWVECAMQPVGTGSFDYFTIYDPGQAIDPAEFPGLAISDSLTLANIARDAMTPPLLPIGISPEDRQVTGLETWIWPDASTDNLQMDVTLDGLIVSVRAVYAGTEFDVGEPGVAPFTCTEFLVWGEGETDPPCSHTYFTERAGVTLTSENSWQFQWRDNAGQAEWGALDLALDNQAVDIDIIDIEALISR